MYVTLDLPDVLWLAIWFVVTVPLGHFIGQRCIRWYLKTRYWNMVDYVDGDNSGIDFPIDTQPTIQWNHIDGPVLHFSDGQMHWLTLRERLRCWFDCDDAHSLQRKHRPRLEGYLHVRRQQWRRQTQRPEPSVPFKLS